MEGIPDGRVHVVAHPYAQMVLTRIRDRNTGQIEFRKGLVKLGRLLGFEIASTFKTVERVVETPLGVKARGVEIPDVDKVVLVTVLRAAMPLTEGLLKVFPTAKQGVISARRVEETYRGDLRFDIEVNYIKLPDLRGEEVAIVADPMLATGSTMLKIIEELGKRGRPKRLIFAHVIATPYGIERVLKAYGEAEIFTVAIDQELNEHGFIVPGLGDAGDRAFG